MAESAKISPVPVPPLNAPATSNICELWAINATCDLSCKSLSLMEPEVKGHEILNLPTYAFYIHNKRLGRHVLFDNGARKDWWNVPPHVFDGVTTKGVAGIDIKHDVHDILAAGGVDPKSIEAVIWSHYHWDHVGNVQLFPLSTDVVVGPGFHTLLPGYPARKEAPFFDSDLEGRNLRELKFDDGLKIGPFQAFDFFGDDSFYILNTPGHTTGHISGLIRTTPTTFVFLGGDISHFPGMYRPTPYVPLPGTIPADTVLDSRFSAPCPCSLFTTCHPSNDSTAARTSPFYRVSSHSNSWYDFPQEAQKSVDGLKALDADENVFVAIAHDPALREVGNFPDSTLNGWKEKGWGKKLHWNFLNELPIDGKPGRPQLVNGLLKDGKHFDTSSV